MSYLQGTTQKHTVIMYVFKHLNKRPLCMCMHVCVCTCVYARVHTHVCVYARVYTHTEKQFWIFHLYFDLKKTRKKKHSSNITKYQQLPILERHRKQKVTKPESKNQYSQQLLV